MAFIILISYVFPFSFVLGKSALAEPEVFNLVDFYMKLLYGGLIGITVIYVLNYLWKPNNKLGDSIGFFNIGEKPSLSYFKRFTAPQLTILALIFFSLIFLSANLLNFKQSFTGLKVLPQQFTPVDSLALSSAIIPSAENLLLAVTIGLLLLGLTFLALRTKMSSNEYGLYAWIVSIFGAGIFGVIWHSTVYSGSDTSLLVVFIFWCFMGLLTIATGLWTIPFIVHLLNNFFIDFTRIFTSDTLLALVVGIIIIGFGGLYYLIYKKRLFGSNNTEVEI